MQSRTLRKNVFRNSNFNIIDHNIVFISYRRTNPDRTIARSCAEMLEEIDGLHYWLDEDDECMQQAVRGKNDIKTALCIEEGLDASSALLGIIGPNTFTSPWIPYEIGGARGRQPYKKPSGRFLVDSNPLIAHLIHDIHLSEVPGFVGLGVPLKSGEEVEQWLKSVADILEVSKSQYLSDTVINSIQSQHGIGEIYRKNVSNLKRSY